MTTARTLANAIGRAKMATALTVGQTAISNAVIRGYFPSSWFLTMKALAAEVGADCPPHLFKMRGGNSPSVDEVSPRQGSTSGKDTSPAQLSGGGE